MTLVRYRRSAPGDRYVESRWGAQAAPFGGIQISPDTDDDYYDAASGDVYKRQV